MGEATLQIERARAQIQGAMAPEVLLVPALRELAGQLGQIDHLTVTPDLLAPLLARVTTAGGGAATGGKGD